MNVFYLEVSLLVLNVPNYQRLARGMNPPSCKAERCREPRVNDNHCARHTRKLHPLYIRYKTVEHRITETDIPKDIPTMVHMYALYARAYRLRSRYREATKTELRDDGHDMAIYRLLTRMRRLDRDLCELTKAQPITEVRTVPGLETQSSDADDETNTTPMDPTELMQFGYNCRQQNRAYDSEMEARLPCILAFNNYTSGIIDKLFKIAAKIFHGRGTEARLRELSNTPTGSDERIALEYDCVNDPKFEEDYGSSVLEIVTKGMLAWRDRKTTSTSLTSQMYTYSSCCAKQAIRIILVRPDLVDIVIYWHLAVMCLIIIGHRNLVDRLRLDLTYEPPNIIYTLRLPSGLTQRLDHTTPRAVPLTLFEHECGVSLNTPKQTLCSICDEEIREHLPYRSLPGHMAPS